MSKGKEKRRFDVVGMGLNAVDHICVIPRFPRYEEKLQMQEFKKTAGGQVASALVACNLWGLKTKYIGKVGGDEMGRFSIASFKEAGVDVEDVGVVTGASNQFAFILVDASTGERTIIWTRDRRLAMLPEEIPVAALKQGRFLLLDGHDAPAAAAAAWVARDAGVRVVVDAETVKAGTQDLVAASHFIVCSREFLHRFAGETDLHQALEKIKEAGPCWVVATLGKDGAIGLTDAGFVASRGFKVKCADSTGAGDVFHGAFIYGLTRDWETQRTLDFANAAAALNCTAIGARGGIKPLEEIFDLMRTGQRW
jgi:sulfofructose kinase